MTPRRHGVYDKTTRARLLAIRWLSCHLDTILAKSTPDHRSVQGIMTVAFFTYRPEKTCAELDDGLDGVFVSVRFRGYKATYTLHVWPSKWGLQSLDPTCLAAVMYLQLTMPGRFKVAPCTNPDESPSGHLPFLTHGHVTVSTFPSIIAFVASLAKSSGSGAIDLDASLTSIQRAKKTALFSHVESCIADLVSHMFFGIDANFWGMTNPALASEMSIPQKYYVASRMRQTYKPRLQAAGLWSLPAEEEEKKGLFEKDKKKKRSYRLTFSRAFERAKILDKAKTALGVHESHLGGKQFYFGDRPTSLDVYLAAHMLLSVDPPFPDSVLQIHLLESYAGLVDHARRVQAEVARTASYEHSKAPRNSLMALIPRPLSVSVTPTPVDPADVKYRRKTLIFVLGVVTVTTACLWQYALLAGSIVNKLESNDEGGELEEAPGTLEGEEEEEVE